MNRSRTLLSISEFIQNPTLITHTHMLSSNNFSEIYHLSEDQRHFYKINTNDHSRLNTKRTFKLDLNVREGYQAYLSPESLLSY